MAACGVDQLPRNLLESLGRRRRAAQGVDQNGVSVSEVGELVAYQRARVPAVGVLHSLAHPPNGQIWSDDRSDVRRVFHEGGEMPFATGKFRGSLCHALLEFGGKRVVLNYERHT